MKVEEDRLKKMLGLTAIAYHDIHHPIAITDLPLGNSVAAASGGGSQIAVDNFSFSPADTRVAAGTTVTWTNRDDVPHTVVSTEKKFASPALDTGDQFSHNLDVAGAYRYFCSLHPRMTGQVVVA